MAPVPKETSQKSTEGAPSRKEKSQMCLLSSRETLQKEKTCFPSFIISLCKQGRSCSILLEKNSAVHGSIHLFVKQTSFGLEEAWG